MAYNTTEGLYIGKPEAEAETVGENALFQQYFQDFLHIETHVRNGSFIITGRKGAGKSAYAVQLKEQAKQNESMFCEMVKKDEFDLEAAMQSLQTMPSLAGEELKYEALFEWIILTRMVRMILECKQGAYIPEVRALREFYRKNAGIVSINQYVVAEVLANKEVNFSPLKKEFGFFSRVFGTKSIKAPFYQMIVPLRDTLRKVLSMDIYGGYKFYVLFDDLDVKFKLYNEVDQNMLMDLVRIVRRYNTEYFSASPLHILIFMRDDIAKRLSGVDCDKNKIFGSYEYCINWYEHDMAQKSEKLILLRQFLNRRLNVAFRQKGMSYNTSDPWLTLVGDNAIDGKTPFKYILDYTFYLPRDIISIFKDMGSKRYKLPLSRDNIDKLLKEYSKSKKEEISDELTALYQKSEIDALFESLREISCGWNVTYDGVFQILRSHNLNIADFQNLIDYDLLVPVDQNNHLFFRYREQEFRGNYQDCTFRVPNILSLYLRNS